MAYVPYHSHVYRNTSFPLRVRLYTHNANQAHLELFMDGRKETLCICISCVIVCLAVDSGTNAIM